MSEPVWNSGRARTFHGFEFLRFSAQLALQGNGVDVLTHARSDGVLADAGLASTCVGWAMNKLLGVAFAAAIVGSASGAQAALTQIDLSPYVNQGFANGGWFINSGAFSSIVGSTTGNQGSTIPFTVANVNDPNKGALNYWFGLDDGSGTNLFGPAGSVTIPIAVSGVDTVYTLIDNTFGAAGSTEFSITFNGSGGPLTLNYVGSDNTKDYNYPNCFTNGCDPTPNATNWFIDPNFGSGLQLVKWNLAPSFGLTSVTFTQINSFNGAIVAGVTVNGGVPEPATWSLMIGGFGLAGAALRRRRRALA